MTTPGRTHISWENESSEIRELTSYIDFLEAKLSYLQYHHEHCDAWIARPTLTGANLPYLPPDIVVASDEADNENNENRIRRAMALTTTQVPQKRPEGNPRWKQIVDQITKGWDKPSSWTEKRVAVGLDSVQQNKYALTAILGLKKDLPLHLGREESTPAVSRESIGNSANTLVTSARQYALDSKASQRNPGLVAQVHVFRELVFISLCVVMEHQGLPIETIDSLMRICISSSGAANLYRLRRGALWVNRVISGTMIKKLGWGHSSTEFFVLGRIPIFLVLRENRLADLCSTAGRPVSQYGLLWEACVHSFPYLSNQLTDISRIVDIPAVDPDWIPFSIPLIIKQLVGDVLRYIHSYFFYHRALLTLKSLEKICLALDYNIDMV
jgi:hypothetical protein